MVKASQSERDGFEVKARRFGKGFAFVGDPGGEAWIRFGRCVTEDVAEVETSECLGWRRDLARSCQIVDYADGRHLAARGSDGNTSVTFRASSFEAMTIVCMRMAEALARILALTGGDATRDTGDAT